MKRLFITLIFLASGVTPLFCMEEVPKEKEEEELSIEEIRKLSPEEVQARLQMRKLEKEYKKKRKKKKKKKTKKEEAKKLAEEKRQAQEEKEQERVLKQYRAHKVLQEERIAQEAEKGVRVVIKNNSRWNALVNYRRPGKKETEKLGRKGSGKDLIEVPDPDQLQYMYIVPDSDYWRENLEELIEQKKVTLPDIVHKIKNIIDLHPGSSIQVNVAIPELRGGKFKGFAFDVKPRIIKPILKYAEFEEKIKSGEFGEKLEDIFKEVKK